MVSSTSPLRLTFCIFRSSLLSSILERSRISEISLVSRATCSSIRFNEDLTGSAFRSCCSCSNKESNSCTYPFIEVIGVLSSWLTNCRKPSLRFSSSLNLSISVVAPIHCFTLPSSSLIGIARVRCHLYSLFQFKILISTSRTSPVSTLFFNFSIVWKRSSG